MIDPVTGWCKITEYNDKCAITVLNLVETMWLTIYIFPTKIRYD